MDKQILIDTAVETAEAAMIRDDICSRSVLLGLQTFCDDISEEMITASLSLAGGTGIASGSCGAYCAGLLGIGLTHVHPLDDELDNPSLKPESMMKCMEYRDRFMAEMGTIMCPEIHEKIFGRVFLFTDPVQNEEFLNTEGHQEKCAEVVAVATRIAAEMMLEKDF